MPLQDDELVIEPCMKINDQFVCGPDYDNKVSYSWEEVAAFPRILLERNASSRRFLENSFNEKNLFLNPQIEVAAHDLLIRFASIHLGLACVIEQFTAFLCSKSVFGFD